MSPSKRTIVALVLVLGGLVYLISTAVSNTTMYYVTVEEALAKGMDGQSHSMRVQGNVVGESIDWRPRELLLSFAVAGESGETIKAVYHGPRPDNFAPDAPAILEGRLGTDGVFQADKLMLACPSRFEAEGAEHPGSMGAQVEH